MTVSMAAPPLRLMFWETTKACNLRCQHCRAVPEAERSHVELTTEESFGLIDQIAEVARPRLIAALERAGVTVHDNPSEDDLRAEFLSLLNLRK